ncbi:MAG: YfhO family protein [Oscillospiraceae bacterium]|nr:YfhO family protein [Oscillospiraceae bacterium]
MNSENQKQKWLFNEKGSVLVSDNEDGIKPMKNKVNPLKWLFKENPFYLAAFFLPAVILFVSYALFKVYPFGEASVLALDLNGQYVYYFDYMHDVFAGGQSLFYSWSRSLSGEFLGIFGYYLASPFNLLVWLFPREYITEGILTMLIAKVGTIGVCMAVYLKRGRNYSAGTAVVFSMMYALCAYVIVQTMNPMWLDGVLALPLVIYGVEALVKHGRYRLLIIALFYSFVTCFYIGYMLGIFTALYFICFLISSRYSEQDGTLVNSNPDVGAVFMKIGLFAISAATAVLMASFILIPVYSSLQLGKSDFTSPFMTPGGELNTDFFGQTNFILADLARKVFPNTYDTVRNESLPAIYSGTLVLILLPLFFFAGKEKVISVRKRAVGAVLALVLILSMYYTPVDTVMHGFQVPNWLPYRYSFMLSFLLITWGAEVFEKLRQFSRRTIGMSALGIFGLLVLFESRDTFDATLGNGGRELFDNATVVIPALLIIVVLTIILLCNKNKRFGKTALAVTVGVVVALELFYNTHTSLNKQDEDISYSDRATYTDFVIPMREAVNEIKEADDGFYRIEKDFHRMVNDPIALGMYGFSHSASTFNEAPVNLLGKLGLTSRGHYTRYSGATPLVNDLFGVRYIMSHSSYSYGQPLADGVLTITHNETALPIAYLTDTRLMTLNLDEYPTDDVHLFRRQNRLLSTMLGEPRVVEYIRTIGAENIEKTVENITEGGTTDGHVSYHATGTPFESSKIHYNITAEADGAVFMWLPTAHERRASVLVQRIDEEGAVVHNDWRGSYFEYDDYCIMNLGEFSAGELFTVTLTLHREDLYYKTAQFAYMDSELYGAAINSLHALNSQTAVTMRSANNLRIDVFADTERLLLTTIPAEPGWTITIDGREIKPVTVLGSLIGIQLPAGTHVIEMKYSAVGYPIALFLSGGGLIIFIILCVIYTKTKKTRAEDEEQDEEDNEQLTIEDFDEFEFEIAEESNVGDDVLGVPQIELLDDGQTESSAPTPEPELDDFFGEIPSEPVLEPEPEPASFMPKSFFAEDDEQLTIDNGQLTIEEEPQEELILGSDEAFESIAADFAEINAEPDVGDDDPVVPQEEEPDVGDDVLSVPLEEDEFETTPPFGHPSTEGNEPDIEIDDGFLPVPEVTLDVEPQEEPDIELDDLVPPEINMLPVVGDDVLDVPQEPDIELDDLSMPEIDLSLPEDEPAPPPPTMGEIDFAARRRALELELMQEREELEQSFSGDISDSYEEEFEITEVTPIEDAQPVVAEAQAEPLFSLEEELEDFLVPEEEPNVGDDVLSVPSEPSLHTPPPWNYDEVFEEFEFTVTEESQFEGTFDEFAEEEDFAIDESESAVGDDVLSVPQEDDDGFNFTPPFGPGTL